MLSFSALSYPYMEVQDGYNPNITDTSKLGDLEGLELGYTPYSRWVIVTQLTCIVKTVPEDLTSLDTDNYVHEAAWCATKCTLLSTDILGWPL